MKTIHGVELQDREEFIDTNVYYKNMDDDERKDADKEARNIRKKVPAHYVAVSSESDGLESRMWHMLADFFGKKIYNSHIPKVTTLKQNGIDGYTTGEMTWSVFVDPEFLKMWWDGHKDKYPEAL